MKTPVSPTWMPGLLLAMAWLPVGLAQNAITPAANTTLTAANAANRGTTVSKDVGSLEAGASTPNTALGNQLVTSEMRLSPWTKEIVKLAQSGIDEEVMLSFIDNSGMFNLGAEQIIYLSDLGVSGQLITEMLQHDREVISGIRPVTIVSELTTETIFPASWKASTGMSSKTSAQPASAPAPSALVTADLSPTPGGGSLAEVNRVVSDVQPAALQYAMLNEGERERAMQSVSDQPSQSSGRRDELYRVREPYPVELLPPIVFMNAAERPANTIIILGFPRDTP
jgi:hypothetical protein